MTDYSKMGLYEFNILPDSEKADIVWEHGAFLTNRVEGRFGINLYSLSDFYVEVWYSTPNNKIEEIRTFKSIEPLEPYLGEIDLDLS